MSIEQELVEATDFQPTRKFDNRQDYLAALARKVDALEQDEFDELTNESVNWFNNAARCMRNKRAIPDFADAGEEAFEVQSEEVKPSEEEAPTQAVNDLEITFDKYGIAVGSKNYQAAQMLEKGCKMAEITDTLGGTFYNLVKRLKRQGHHIEREANGFMKLTHADEYGAKAKGKRK